MIIYIGSDHGGFGLKQRLIKALKDDGYEVADLGDSAPELADDYVDFAKLVAEKVSVAPEEARGILICRSGFGVDIVANKFKGVRSALATSPDHIYQGRHDDDVNVLSIAADFTDADTAEKMVKVFLSTPFGTDERYTRRLRKIEQIEEGR